MTTIPASARRAGDIAGEPQKRLTGLDRPIAVALIAVAIGSIFVVLRLASYEWNPTGFVHAGDRFVDASSAPSDLLIRRNAVGFDGTGFYRLALNPFTHEQDEYGIVLDVPAFRHQRIVYPFLVWALSGGGRASAVGWGLIGVNLLAIGAVGWIGAVIAIALRRPASWGLLFPMYPGFAISLGLDTAEIVTAALALGGVAALLRRRYGWSTLLLTAAMFSRETSLLIAIGIGLGWLWSRLRGRRDVDQIPAYVFVVPAVMYVAWQAVLRVVWGQVPVERGGAMDIEPPLYGLTRAAQDWPETDVTQAVYHFVLVAALIAFATTGLLLLRRSSAPVFALIGFGSGIALGLLFSEAIWLHHWGFLRAFTETYLLGAIVLLGTRIRLARVLAGAAGLWVSLAVNLTLHP